MILLPSVNISAVGDICSSSSCRKMKSENDLVKASSFKDERDGVSPRRQASHSSMRAEGCPWVYGCGHIIRVSMQGEDSCNLYKSIWVSVDHSSGVTASVTYIVGVMYRNY